PLPSPRKAAGSGTLLTALRPSAAGSRSTPLPAGERRCAWRFRSAAKPHDPPNHAVAAGRPASYFARSMSAKPRVAIVEERRALREGLQARVGDSGDFQIVGAYGSMEQALPRLEADPPEILLADIGLPGMSGIEGVRRLKGSHPEVQILMLTVYADNEHV